LWHARAHLMTALRLCEMGAELVEVRKSARGSFAHLQSSVHVLASLAVAAAVDYTSWFQPCPPVLKHTAHSLFI
jgi:hypothetical protein